MNVSTGIFFDSFYLPIQLSFIDPWLKREGATSPRRSVFAPATSGELLCPDFCFPSWIELVGEKSVQQQNEGLAYFYMWWEIQEKKVRGKNGCEFSVQEPTTARQQWSHNMKNPWVVIYNHQTWFPFIEKPSQPFTAISKNLTEKLFKIVKWCALTKKQVS